MSTPQLLAFTEAEIHPRSISLDLALALENIVIMADRTVLLNPTTYRRLLKATEHPVNKRTRTKYRCTQGQIDAYQDVSGEDVPGNGDRRKMIRYFNSILMQEPAETSSLQRLARVIKHPPSPWGPDLVIKAFHDIDTVFFNGKLQGRVRIRWVRHVDKGSDEGETFGGVEPLEHSRSEIRLYARIFELKITNPYMIMWRTVFHETAVSDLNDCEDHQFSDV